MDPFKIESPTEYSKFRIQEYSKIIQLGEALSDLERVKNYGVNSKNDIELYLWRVFKKWFAHNKGDSYTLRDIVKGLRIELNIDPLLKPFDLDSSPWKAVNRFRFIGLLILDPNVVHRYYFDPVIIVNGIEWFRIGNLYMKGSFQAEECLFPELVKL